MQGPNLGFFSPLSLLLSFPLKLHSQQHCPTEHFTILEPQNSSDLHNIRLSSDFEALELRNTQTGSCNSRREILRLTDLLVFGSGGGSGSSAGSQIASQLVYLRLYTLSYGCQLAGVLFVRCRSDFLLFNKNGGSTTFFPS